LTLSCTLDQPGISLDGEDDDRGTNLTHEYAAFETEVEAKSAQAGVDKAANPMYRANAIYHTKAILQAKVEQHCTNVFSFLEDEDEDVQISGAVKSEYPGFNPTHGSHEAMQSYNSAIEYFFPMVRGEMDYQTKEQIKTYFKEQYELRKTRLASDECTPYTADDETFTETVDHLMTLMLELLQTRTETRDARDLVELQELYKEMSKPGPTTEAHPWRAMEKLRVHSDLPLLRTGAILGDTPGSGDADLNITEGAMQYLRGAGFLVLCHLNTRAASDLALVQEAMAVIVDLSMTRKCVLVLTAIDKRKPKKRTEEQKARLLELFPDDTAAISSAQQEEAELRASQCALTEKIDTLDDERQSLFSKLADKGTIQQLQGHAARLQEVGDMSKDAQEDLKAVTTHIEQVQETIEQLQTQTRNKMDQAAVLALCHETKEKLKDQIRIYTRNPAEPDLRVICVSGQQYEKHLTGADGADAPVLDKEATGIPELQRWVEDMTTKTRFSKLKKIATVHVPRLIRDAITQLSRSEMPLNTMDAVQNDTRSRIRGDIDEILDFLSTRIGSAYAKHVTATFENNVKEWMKDTEREARYLPEERHASTFKSCCGKKGNRRVKELYKCSWNKLLIESYRDDIDRACDAFQSECRDIQGELVVKIMKLFDQVKETLGPYKVALRYDGSFTAIQYIQDEVLANIETLWKKQRERLSEMRTDFVMNTDLGIRISYVERAMSPAYRKANAILSKDYEAVRPYERAQAAHRARILLVKESIFGNTATPTTPGLPNVFEAVKERSREDFQRKLNTILRENTELLKTNIRERTMDDLNNRYGKSPLDTEADFNINSKLLVALRDGLNRLEVEGKRLVAQCEEQSKRPGLI
jgi:hypothetical protein